MARKLEYALVEASTSSSPFEGLDLHRLFEHASIANDARARAQLLHTLELVSKRVPQALSDGRARAVGEGSAKSIRATLEGADGTPVERVHDVVSRQLVALATAADVAKQRAPLRAKPKTRTPW